MATYYIDTGGSATNSGTSDTNSAKISGASGATGVSVSGTTVTFPALTDLTSVITTIGSTQDAIYIADATNANQKIFPITAKAGSGGATPTVTVSVAPTGTITTSQWSIGGRHVLTNAAIEGAPVAGDIVQFNNSPAAQSASVWLGRNSGSTSGFIKIIGKSGTRPILTTTGNNTPFNNNSATNIWVENLEFQCQGATGAGFINASAACITYNCKVTDCGTTSAFGVSFAHMCEVTGGLGDGISFGGGTVQACYSHDNAGNGYVNTNNNANVIASFCIAANNGGRGFYWSGAPTSQNNYFYMLNCTAYGNQNNGVDAANNNASFRIFNCIFQDNGWNTSGYNANSGIAQELIGFHAYNVFYNSGILGGSNLNNYTANAQISGSEFTTDPLFTATGMGTFASTDVSTGADTITINSHGLSNNDKFMIQSTSGAVPTGLAVKTPYFVIVVDPNTIKLTNTYNGSAIDITGAGSGTNRYSASVISNFGIAASSPAKGTGTPGQFLGGASIGYPDMGAVQRQESGSTPGTIGSAFILN